MLPIKKLLDIPESTPLVVDNAHSPTNALSMHKKRVVLKGRNAALELDDRWSGELERKPSIRPVQLRSRSMDDLFSVKDDHVHHSRTDEKRAARMMRIPARPPSPISPRPTNLSSPSNSFPGVLTQRAIYLAAHTKEHGHGAKASPPSSRGANGCPEEECPAIDVSKTKGFDIAALDLQVRTQRKPKPCPRSQAHPAGQAFFQANEIRSQQERSSSNSVPKPFPKAA